MKPYVLIGTLILCTWGGVYAYEPSLYEAERLQTAEKLLWAVPEGMQHDIQQKLINYEDKAENERERFCIQYLLYQINIIAKENETTATTDARVLDGLISRVIDENTFVINIYGQEKIVSFDNI